MIERGFDSIKTGNALARRRFLSLTAAGSGAALCALAGGARAQQQPVVRAAPVTWAGRLMGAESSLVLHHDDTATAQQALVAVLARVRALESLFSLHLETSALCRLNASGELSDAPAPLLALLHQCRALHAATDGAFDPAIQPLFALYADHFGKPGADPRGPSPQSIAMTRTRTGFAGVHFGRTGVRFTRPGMALTLNGIAQGYITDQATKVLKQYGLSHCLVNFGEYRALGGHPSGRPWAIALSEPQAPWKVMETVTLSGGAIATSAGAGAQFDAAGRFSHLINPQSGRSATAIASVSVLATTATLADALSTALAVAPIEQTTQIMQRFADAGALVRWPNGRITRFRFPGPRKQTPEPV